jgi:hypothetical protein
MAQRFKAKTLLSNTGVFNNELYVIDSQSKYILSNSNSIRAIDPISPYTGGLFFNQSGFNLKFINKNGSYQNLNPIEVTTGNEVLINGNYSFGSYTSQITGSGTSNFRLFKTDRLQDILQDIKISGIKTGNTITVFSSGTLNKSQNSNSLGKAAQYLVVPSGDIAYNSYNTIIIESGAYSGLALRKFKTGPTIKNDYKYNFSLEASSTILPRERSLETIYEVNVPDGGDPVRYLSFEFPVVTTSNNAIIILKLNFEASNSPCSVICNLYNAQNDGFRDDPSFTINAADYSFTQIERVMYHYRGYDEAYGGSFYVRI